MVLHTREFVWWSSSSLKPFLTLQIHVSQSKCTSSGLAGLTGTIKGDSCLSVLLLYRCADTHITFPTRRIKFSKVTYSWNIPLSLPIIISKLSLTGISSVYDMYCLQSISFQYCNCHRKQFSREQRTHFRCHCTPFIPRLPNHANSFLLFLVSN